MTTLTSAPPPPPRRRWPRVLLWVGIVIAAVIVVAIVATALVLRSRWFQNYVQRTAQEQGSLALGVPVHISRLQLHVQSLAPSLDAYGVRVAGRPVPGMQSTMPLLELAHARVQVTITSLLHRSWHIEDITLDQPIVHVLINRQGENNLPAGSGPAPSTAGPDVFALAIRHAAIQGGEVYINDTAQSLNADLRNVELALAYSAKPPSYAGKFSYGPGTVQLAGMPAVATNMAMQFTASRQGVRVPSLVLTTAGARVDAGAELSGYAQPRLSVHYRADLDLTILRTALRQPALPRGEVQFTGTAGYASHALSASGSFASAELRELVSSVTMPIRQLRGQYRFADGSLAVRAVHAVVAGGSVSAELTLDLLGHAPTVEARMRLQGAHLDQLARLAPQGETTLKALGITGTMDITGAAHGPLNLAEMAAGGQAEIRARMGAVPLQAAVEAAYAGGQLTLRNTSLRTPHAQISVAGSLSTRQATPAAHLTVHASSDDLSGLESIAGHWAAALGHPLPAVGLAGQGTLTANVAGTLRAPQLSGQFTVSQLAVRKTHWASVRGQFEANPAHAALQAHAIAGGHASVDVSGGIGLSGWSTSPASLVTGALAVHGLALSELAPLAPSPLPLSGILNAEAHVRGTLGAPEGQGSATLRPVRLAGKVQAGLEAVQASFHGDRSSLAAQVTAQLSAGQVVVAATFHPATGAYTANVESATLDLGKLPLLRSAQTGIQGALALRGSGAGTVAAPEFQMTVTSSHLAVDGQAIHDFNAQFHLQGRQLQVEVAATALQSPLHAEARVTLAGEWPATASLTVPAGPLTPLLAAFAPEQAANLEGEVGLNATLRGPLRDPARLDATITLPALSLAYDHVVSVHAAAPVQARIAGGVVEVQPVHLVGPNTDFQLQGTIPVPALGAARGAKLQGTLRGTVNLQLGEVLAPELSTSGEAVVQISAGGTLAQPSVAGDIQISNASASSPDWPVSLQNGHGALRLHDGRVDLVGFTATVGGGTVTLSGGMALRSGGLGPGAPKPPQAQAGRAAPAALGPAPINAPRPQFNLSIAAREVRVRYPEGLRETISADVNLTGSPAAALLSGRARVESVTTAPGFDFATLTSQLAQNTVVVVTPGNLLAGLRLEVVVTTPNQIAITSRDFSLHANANLTVRGTALEPIVLGRVALTSGDLLFRGSRYVIQSGTLDFVNPIRTVPTVNVTADTTIQQYNLHLHFQGSVDNLRTAYTSDPALPPADIINLLAFGQTTEAGAANPLPGNLGAETLVAGAVTGQITDRVEKIAGISHLSVDPILGGGQQNAGARITIQQRVTGNLYVTISTDVTSTQRNVIEVQYHFSPRVSISGVRKQNGGFGANLQFKKVWH